MRKKAERRWTVMVVPHGSGSSRAVEVSQTFVKALVGIGSVVALTFLVLGVAAISRGVNITRSRALENENRLLADEIQRMRERMTVLRDTLHHFSQREQELRLLAGLTPTDTTVQQAGIGGPAGTWSERDSLKALGADGSGDRGAGGGHRDRGAVGRGLRQHRHDGPWLWTRDALRPLLEDSRGARPAREARAGDRESRLHRAFHGTAPALRGVGESQAGRPHEVRHAGCHRRLTHG